MEQINTEDLIQLIKGMREVYARGGECNGIC